VTEGSSLGTHGVNAVCPCMSRRFVGSVVRAWGSLLEGGLFELVVEEVSSPSRAEIVVRRGHPSSGSSAAVTSAAVISRRCPRVSAQFSRIASLHVI
jgi:hypothetical protein